MAARVVLRPFPLLLAASLALGAAHLGRPVLGLASTAPATRFTEGQFINLALAARELPWPFHTELLGYPAGASFAPLLWPAVPVAAVLGPTVALNLVFLLLPGVNAALGWAGARLCGARPWGAFTTGGLCAFSSWVHNTLANGQLEQVPLGGAALLWGLVAWALRRGPLASSVVTVVALGIGLAAPHVGVAALLGGVVLVAVGLVRPPAPPQRRDGLRRPWRSAAFVTLALVLAGAGAHAYHAPQFGRGQHVFAPKGAVTSARGGNELPGLYEVATPARLLLPPSPPAPQAQNVAHAAWLGWAPLAGALVSPGRHLLVAGVLATASMGEELDVLGGRLPLPAAAYETLSLALSRSANPYRLALGAVAALTLASGLGVRRAGPALLLVGAGWAETALFRTRPIPLASQDWAPAAATSLLAEGEGPVLDLPLASPTCPDMGWTYAREAMWHGRPVPLTLRFDWRAWGELEPLARRLGDATVAKDCPDRLPPLLTEGGFTGVVLHRDARCAVHPWIATCLEAALGPPVVAGEALLWKR